MKPVKNRPEWNTAAVCVDCGVAGELGRGPAFEPRGALLGVDEDGEIRCTQCVSLMMKPREVK